MAKLCTVQETLNGAWDLQPIVIRMQRPRTPEAIRQPRLSAIFAQKLLRISVSLPCTVRTTSVGPKAKPCATTVVPTVSLVRNVPGGFVTNARLPATKPLSGNAANAKRLTATNVMLWTLALDVGWPVYVTNAQLPEKVLCLQRQTTVICHPTMRR